jgi:hypothetical protein
MVSLSNHEAVLRDADLQETAVSHPSETQKTSRALSTPSVREL